MNKDEMNIVNRINDNRPKIPIFKGDSMLQGVFDKVVGKTFRMNDGQGQQQQRANSRPRQQAPPAQMSSEQKARRVIQADQMVRQQMQELINSLTELGDREIALKLISDHIFFLNDIFKDFEGKS